MSADRDLSGFYESGFYEEGWRWQFTENDSRSIAEDSVRLLSAERGHILDWCGGWGRVSRHLAAMGFRITILDFTEKYLKEAREAFGSNEDLTLVHADCRNTPPSIQADYAICTLNSIGFLPDDEQAKAFRSLHGALVPHGRAIFDCVNLLFMAKHFIARMDSQRPDGLRLVRSNNLDLQTSILHTHFQLVDERGAVCGENEFTQRIYTPAELCRTLQVAGFRINGIYGNYRGDALSLDLPQMVTVAEKG